jgi:hypothetical protein
MVTRLLWLVALVACQGRDDTPATPAPPPPAPARDAIAQAPLPTDAPELPATPDDAKPDEPEPPTKVIADLGAIPAWQAVIDRAQLLGRRGQHGVVYGRVGPPIMQPATAPDAGLVASPYTWLVDDTDGNGALGIRVALANRPVKEGDRVALGGAWQLDDEHHWFWKVDVVQPLAPAPKSDLKDLPWPVPSHTIPMGNVPYGARTITLGKDNDAVYFMIVGPAPATEGDGWAVANELGDPVYALLRLPGERPAYGSLDMRSPDERWQLKRGQTYWVRIGEVHKREGKPVLLNARTAPVRVN